MKTIRIQRHSLIIDGLYRMIEGIQAQALARMKPEAIFAVMSNKANIDFSPEEKAIINDFKEQIRVHGRQWKQFGDEFRVIRSNTGAPC